MEPEIETLIRDLTFGLRALACLHRERAELTDRIARSQANTEEILARVRTWIVENER
jgi:hypothetical protein